MSAPSLRLRPDGAKEKEDAEMHRCESTIITLLEAVGREDRRADNIETRTGSRVWAPAQHERICVILSSRLSTLTSWCSCVLVVNTRPATLRTRADQSGLCWFYPALGV